ncbi:hypothetical protein O7632_16710 [Solwaraspora sp. WMMD406]|uniref:hypothetical protein n=1 Tax=Solwaraspora sp. WMMD406 TaxID=3016095 RepID=UPI002416756B|nr:hypothetical protein [Solwaraspora sp. WMMD406]MDG4765725.1 hypothetical protein [Solwaraspora sp. WMMD406]
MSGRGGGFGWWVGVRGRVAVVTVVVVSASLLAAPGVVAAPVGSAGDPGVGQRSVPVSEARVAAGAGVEPGLPGFVPREPVWPVAVSGVVDVPAVDSVPVGGSGFAVGPAPSVEGGSAGRPGSGSGAGDGSGSVSRVGVEVLDRSVAVSAGVSGVLFRVVRADGGLVAGRVGVEVDTSGFSGAFGGDWGARLGVVAFPGCVVTSPEGVGCGVGRPVVSSRLDNGSGVVSAVVEAVPGVDQVRRGGVFAGLGESSTLSSGGAVVFAVTGVQSGETGDFTKTPLSVSAEWSSGGSSGDFGWSYGMGVPPVPGGLEPQVGLGYSSGGVDGQTAGRNVQAGAVGEGWDLRAGGYIERAYRSCADDLENPAHYTEANGDLCWRLPNLRLVWGGKSTELVRDGSGRWRLADDDGEMVQAFAGSNNGDQGDLPSNTGEYWRLTTQDGTQYYFGLETVPGNVQTNSTATVRVRANNQGEPCFDLGGFAVSSCWQAWRWSLSYVVDVHGNAMAYFYEKEVQRSGFGAGGTQSYDRAVRLTRIDYGVTASTGFAGDPPARVEFTWSDRCVSSCGSAPSSPAAANWPDTPWDLYCGVSASSCPSNPAPSFWSDKRLTSVSTSVRTGPGANRRVVDSWVLEQLFPATGNSTSAALWLQSITRTGSSRTPAVVLPQVRFGGTRRDQRADYDPNAGMAQPRKYRVSQVFTETGGRIDVTYLSPGSGCQFGGSFPDPDNNIHRCFPKYWKPEDNSAGFGWWNKYIVTRVVENDLVGGSPPVVHDYQYTLGSASGSAQVLWGHENGAAVYSSSLPYRSWSDWRGYTDVTTTVGPTSGGMRSQTRRVYFRGLSFDLTDTGEDRVSTVSNSLSEVVRDDLWRRGQLLEEIVFDGAGGIPLSKSVYTVEGWQTGARTYPAHWAVPTVHHSVLVRVGVERHFTWVTDTASWRESETEHSWHQTFGYRTELSDLGDPTVTTDDRCTRTWYSSNINTNLYLVGVANRTQLAEGPCKVAPTSGQVLSESRVFHDHATTHGAAPTKGGVPMGSVKQRGGVRPPVWAGMAVGCGAWRGGRRRGGGRGR